MAEDAARAPIHLLPVPLHNELNKDYSSSPPHGAVASGTYSYLGRLLHDELRITSERLHEGAFGCRYYKFGGGIQICNDYSNHAHC